MVNSVLDWVNPFARELAWYAGTQAWYAALWLFEHLSGIGVRKQVAFRGQQKALHRARLNSVIDSHKASPGLASSTQSQGGNQIKSPLSFASV
jgi:hypothetical protein